ncbi:hypothetical protein GGS23DRAFT_481151 [Durotheca rogersii]|uniref:uncharacterized protein n=1 Tax=Durotheca rogersii TaxID=419775 RepID=UPI002220568F|nr:uncharacterized protein GGS23DRAFT_481151 [Durotheca rogersii]KAI5864074.1 hypothetical protein GGS23DRAFT_481151 [Durotheca rogersii]
MPPSYAGRRGQAVNVSQLLQDLNRGPEPPAPMSEENLRSLDDELAMFTNTNFIDWDANESQQQQQPPRSVSVNLDTQSTTSPTEEGPIGGDLSAFDFNIPGDYNGFDFHPYSTPNVSPFSDNLANLQPIQPSSSYPQNGSPPSPYGPSMPQTGEKRKADAAAPPPRRQLSFEEQSRLAAEEDKRRRNTAASARFRIKKKAREQALEKREKELSEKVGSLEGRIQTLETENKWLRELVMEKTGGNETLISTLLEKQNDKKIPAGKESDSSSKATTEDSP